MNPLYLFWGKVQKGKGRGKRLGFPTANITLHKKIPEGVYASRLTFDGQNRVAATFIGSAKTFEEHEYKAESYVLDFRKSMYGRWTTIRLFKKLRRNKKFKSPQELIEQMKHDIVATRKYFR